MIARYWGVAQNGEEIIFLRMSVSDRDIAFFIREFMVIPIVGRNPNEDGQPVKNSQPPIGEGIECSIFPDFEMLMIVSHHWNGNGSQQINRVGYPIEAINPKPEE